MEENNVVADNSNTAEDVALESTEEASNDTDLQSELAKAKELAENYKIRAEKAERKAKETITVSKPQVSNSGLSTEDFYALTLAKVPEEDIEEVSNYAKYKGLSIKEALKTTVLKTQLIENAEKRMTASASNTGQARRGTSRLTDEDMIVRAEKGDLPDDVEALARAQMNARKNLKRQ